LSKEVRTEDALYVPIKSDYLCLDWPEVLKTVVVGGPTLVGMTVWKQVAIDYAISVDCLDVHVLSALNGVDKLRSSSQS